jgi:hypothetical protein
MSSEKRPSLGSNSIELEHDIDMARFGRKPAPPASIFNPDRVITSFAHASSISA